MNFPNRQHIKWLLLTPFLIAFFYNAAVLLYASESMGNPETPLLVKMSKDLGTVLCFAGLMSVFLRDADKSLRWYRLLAILAPVVLGFVMMMIASMTYRMDPTGVGVLKNYIFYYAAAGLTVLVAQMYDMELMLYRCFFKCSAWVVIIGLFCYFAQAVTGLSFTHSGRMISTLGNPNFVGFVMALFIVMTMGQVYFQGRWTRDDKIKLLLGGTGLLLSMSFAAILLVALWVVLMFFMTLRAKDSRSRFFRFNLIWFMVGGLGAFFSVAVVGLQSQSMLFEKIQAIFSSSGADSLGFVGPRLKSMFDAFYAVSSSWQGFFTGHEDMGYIETDGAFLNLALNFGAVVLAAWIGLFMLAIGKGVLLMRRSLDSLDFIGFQVRVLTPFLMLSVAIHFWIQYIPEKFPTCLFIGWVAYQIAFYRDPNAVSARAEADLREEIPA